MKAEYIDLEKQKAMEARLGCTFCDNGEFAEMSLDLANYSEHTLPISNVSFGIFDGNTDYLKKAVYMVDEKWCKYFNESVSALCGYINGQIVSFCIIDTDADCIISKPGIKVGSIGCVGTIPGCRNIGIGLRMVDLATLFLKGAGCHKSYISYTHIDAWYSKLGYRTFARFTFKQ